MGPMSAKRLSWEFGAVVAHHEDVALGHGDRPEVVGAQPVGQVGLGQDRARR